MVHNIFCSTIVEEILSENLEELERKTGSLVLRMELLWISELLLAVEAALVGLVEEEHQLAGVLLELLADQQPVDEDGGVGELLAVAAVDGEHDGMEAGQLAEHFLLGEVVADVVADEVAAPAQLQRGGVVADGGDCLEGLAAAQTDEQLRLARAALPHQGYLFLARPRLPPRQVDHRQHHGQRNQVQVQMTARLASRHHALHTLHDNLPLGRCRWHAFRHS